MVSSSNKLCMVALTGSAICCAIGNAALAGGSFGQPGQGGPGKPPIHHRLDLDRHHHQLASWLAYSYGADAGYVRQDVPPAPVIQNNSQAVYVSVVSPAPVYVPPLAPYYLGSAPLVMETGSARHHRHHVGRSAQPKIIYQSFSQGLARVIERR